MKKYLIVLMVIIAVTLTACGKSDNNEKSDTKIDKLEISLYDNASTGYHWEYSVSEDGIIKIDIGSKNDCPKDVVGCGGEAIYTITGLKPGKVTLNLEYKFVDGSRMEYNAIYEITVNDDLSISESHSGTYFDKEN